MHHARTMIEQSTDETFEFKIGLDTFLKNHWHETVQYSFIYCIVITGYQKKSRIRNTIFVVAALFLLDTCCQVKEVGGVKYFLEKASDIKPASTCKDGCIYRKSGPSIPYIPHFTPWYGMSTIPWQPREVYYCFKHGELCSKCIEPEKGKEVYNHFIDKTLVVDLNLS